MYQAKELAIVIAGGEIDRYIADNQRASGRSIGPAPTQSDLARMREHKDDLGNWQMGGWLVVALGVIVSLSAKRDGNQAEPHQNHKSSSDSAQ
jgi:hypothetical protein